MWTAMARRAEAVISAKAEIDYRSVNMAFPGAGIRRFGRVVATRIPALPDHVPYNKARGFSEEDKRAFDDVRGFFVEVGVSTSVEVWAEDATENLHRVLLGAGLTPAAPTVTLHTRPGGMPAGETPEVQVQELDQGHGEYLDVLLDGYGVDSSAQRFRRMLAVEHATPGLRRYLATVDGSPAAAAALFVAGDTSLLAGAATLPGFRGRGCQTALIARRLADAAACSDLTVVTAAFASASHGNLARQGFQITHTRTVWH